ncbi:hypothetical protein C0Q70_09076 [Pomacea canaliculata]|uniref:MYCBP-associated protein n=1 Tax=Pomacea canaliculata TaxID=400727 RepID=A0A2T7P8S9_POMCA|nr:uncharacterized protein LOC112564255 [Pomacea canaliculata]PVD29819.1 hypothetical protein C0Q70_09076 [Pomacea canaliculata]
MKKESALKKNVKLVVESKLLSKILPRRISALSFLEQSEESTEDIPVEPPPDPFNLRYNERLASKKIRTRHVSDPVIPVLVKRPFAHKPPVVRPFTLGLQLALDEKKQSLTLYEPLSQFTRSKVETLKLDRVQKPWCQHATLRRELAKQELALHAWEDRLKSVTRKTTWISKKIRRPTTELLFSTPLILPPPQDHQGRSHGPEHDFPKVKHQERFYHSDAFFWMPQRVGPAEFAIDTSPTWTEKKFYKPSMTIARPRLDDMLPSSLRNEKRYQDQERARKPLKNIVVKGAAAQLRCPSLVAQCLPDDDRRETSEKIPSPHGAISDPVHSTACLMVEGKMYYWGEQCIQDLVEVGFVCRAGERAYNEIRLANMGSTVIQCVWCKDVHSNHFNKGHYFNEHFIFDSSDRILLPLDQVTLKVQFHADYPGFWREVWHLKTKPALGPDGSSNIPISLWARALVSDDNKCRRRELEEQLDFLVTNRIAANIADQLMRNLPYGDHKTIPVTEDMFVVDDVELFEKANPGLSYHGHAMFTIMKVYRKVREFRRPTTEVDKENFILERQPTTPQKTEESNEKGKIPVVLSSKKISVQSTNVGWNMNVGQARRDKLSQNGELKYDVIDVKRPSRTHDGPRKTEVDELLEGNRADQDPLEPRNITVKDLHNMVEGLDETLEEKDHMFMELNEAVSDMSFHRDQPNVHNFKHMVCRTMLCQAADDVAGIAQRLRHDMRLGLRTEYFSRVTSSNGSTDNGVKMLTAVHHTSKGEKLDVPNQKEDAHRRPTQKRSIVRTKKLSKVNGHRPSIHSQHSLNDVTKDIIPMISATEVTSSVEMYRNVLSVLVYERVERLLLDLLPLMTCDRPQLDPLKHRPEL